MVLAGAIAGSVVLSATLRAIAMECTHPISKQVLEEITIGTLFEVAIEYLKDNQVSYTVFAKNGQTISSSELGRKGYEAIQPVEIVVVSDFKRPLFFVLKSEVLTLTFAEKRRVVGMMCKEALTGP